MPVGPTVQKLYHIKASKFPARNSTATEVVVRFKELLRGTAQTAGRVEQLEAIVNTCTSTLACECHAPKNKRF